MTTKIYIVEEHYQDHDSDDYCKWIGSKVHSYHASKEGADMRVKELIAEKLKTEKEVNIPLNPHLDNVVLDEKYGNMKYWDYVLGMIERNEIEIEQFHGGSAKSKLSVFPLFYVFVTDLKP